MDIKQIKERIQERGWTGCEETLLTRLEANEKRVEELENMTPKIIGQVWYDKLLKAETDLAKTKAHLEFYRHELNVETDRRGKTEAKLAEIREMFHWVE